MFKLSKLKAVTLVNIDPTHVDYIRINGRNKSYQHIIDSIYSNSDYKNIKKLIKNNIVNGYYICSIMTYLDSNILRNQIHFFRYCEHIKILYLNQRGFNYKQEEIDQINNTIYNLSTLFTWETLKGDLTEYIVFSKVKLEKFYFLNEASFYYKKNEMFRNKSYKDKKFDIFGNYNLKYILAEVKYKLETFITTNRKNNYTLTEKLLGQVQKINALEKFLSKCLDEKNNKPKVKKFIFTYHVPQITNIINLDNSYEIVKIENLFINPNYLHSFF